MRIAYIAAGAAGMYCGNCLRDHALARAAQAAGEELVLVPTYTPLLTDQPQGEETHRERLFLNGARAYLAEKLAYFRRPRPILDRLLGSKLLVGLLGRLRVPTRPAKLGELTVAMLSGEEGSQASDIAALARWLREELRPDVIHISNALLIGVARTLRAETGAPVVCSLQSEELFVEGLVEPFRSRAVELIRERLGEVDALLAVSSFHADWAARRFGLERERIRVVLSGAEIDPRPLERRREAGAPLTIAYLARLAPEKGLDILVDAFCRLAKRPGLENTRLEVAGYLGTEHMAWVSSLRRRLASMSLASRARFLGTITPQAKRDLLARADVLCVPTRHPEPKGLFAFEALASGVPLVLPDHGAFPELIERSGGGLLVPSNDVDALAETLETLLLDVALRERLGAEGRAAAERYFHSGRMAAETIEVYREVLENREASTR